MTTETGAGAALPEGILELHSKVDSATSTAVQLRLAGDIRPSERTDFVFILDVSPTLQESIRTGEFASQTYGILENVLEYDDDGIDFILASTLSDDSSHKTAIWNLLASGATPAVDILTAAHTAFDAGQCVSAADIAAALARPEASSSLASVLAPAIRHAKGIRKPRGRLFIEIITDGRIDDLDAVVAEISSMSNECDQKGEDSARYRIHMLGIGDADRKTIDYLDDGIEDVAPVDIVASTIATDHQNPAESIFKEMQAYMTGGDAGFLELSAPGLTGANLNGEPMESMGGGTFSAAFERVALEVNLALTFKADPTPVNLELIVGGLATILDIPPASA